MIFFNLLRLSIRNFKNMKLRSMLTILGIGIGIGAILFLVSLGQGLQRLLIERITTAEALLTLDVLPPGGEKIALNKEAVESIKAIPTVAEISPVKSAKARSSFEGVTASVTANFIGDNFFRLSGLDKQLTKTKDQARETGAILFKDEKSAVITLAVAKLLSMDDPINKIIDVKVAGPDNGAPIAESFTIIDVMNDELLSAVYLPGRAYPPEREVVYDNLKVSVTSTVVLEQVRESIVAKGFLVSALSDTVRQANRVFSIMKVILAIFGIIALVVAAIGMFNTMTIALLERTNEIGIMRSIGASRIDIWVMFLTEAFIIGFFGGVSGVGVGVGGGELANMGLNFLASRLGGKSLDVFYYPLWFIIGIVLFSTIVALITGFYPAQRAAHLNPLDALRYK